MRQAISLFQKTKNAGRKLALVFLVLGIFSPNIGALTPEARPLEIGGGQVKFFQSSRLLWSFKINQLTLKETPDLLELPEIYDGTIYSADLGQPQIENIQARDSQLHSKTGQFRGRQIRGKIILPAGKRLKISGKNFSFNAQNNQGFIKDESILELAGRQMITRNLAIDSAARRISSAEKFLVKTPAFELSGQGFYLDLKQQKIFLTRNLKLCSGQNMGLRGESGEYDLATNQLLIRPPVGKTISASYRENKLSFRISSRTCVLDLEKESLRFGPDAHLSSGATRASADYITFQKNDRSFIFSGNVNITRNKNETVRSGEAVWRPEKNELLLTGRIKTRINLKNDSTAKTFFYNKEDGSGPKQDIGGPAGQKR